MKTVTKKKSNNTILYGGLAVLGIVGLMSFSSKPKQEETPAPTTQPSTPPTSPSQPSTQVKVPNKYVFLKIGSRGIEVAELQKLLNITADGVFGPQTESALFIRKGIKATNLYNFYTSIDVNSNPYAIKY